MAFDNLIAKLFEQPQSFDFFQAVHLLEQSIALEKTAGISVDSSKSLGQNKIRFRSVVSLSFPVSSINYIVKLPPSSYELFINFIGLIGPSGVLPDHYTELILKRLQAKDSALKDFLDIFTHRLTSLFYQAWKKYHFYFTYENNFLDNSLTRILSSLIGIGTEGLQQRFSFKDEALLYYAGLLAQQNRSANTLGELLTDYFEAPIKVKEFQGTWLRLAKTECTKLAAKSRPKGRYAQLGISAILGNQVWNIQNKFRLIIGPLSYKQFLNMLPTGNILPSLKQLTRFYVGAHYQFDVQLILRKDEVPHCNLSKSAAMQLGWNTWLKREEFTQNADQAIINII